MQLNGNFNPQQKNGMIAYLMQEEEVNGQQAQHATPGEHEEDLSAEGYLPEIYFQLKSDNPADW